MRHLLFSTVVFLAALGQPAKATALESSGKAMFAFRDQNSSYPGHDKMVRIQGEVGGRYHFENSCGKSGSRCDCLLYRGIDDRRPLRAAGLLSSRLYNAISCKIPDSTYGARQISHVQLRKRGAQAVTGKLRILDSLRLENILGQSLKKEKVRGIFRYHCDRTFFEGEGVGAHQITCFPGQHLGVLTARYHFYTYRSGEDSNLSGGDSAFRDSICGRNNFLKTQCTGNTPVLRYGLYKENKGLFQVGITLTRAPEGENLSESYGFASLPDENGHCFPGLVKARPYVAQPASIVGGDLDGSNPPSSFINLNNSLNDTQVEAEEPAPFTIMRSVNETPCDSMTGNCLGATFGAAQVARQVAYTSITPVVCVMPEAMVRGLF